MVEWTWTRSGDATGIVLEKEIRDNIWSLAYVDALAMQAVRNASGSGQDASRTYPIHDATFNVTALVTKNASGIFTVSHRFLYDPHGSAYLLSGTGADIKATPLALVADLNWSYLHHGGYHSVGPGRDGLYHFRRRSDGNRKRDRSETRFFLEFLVLVRCSRSVLAARLRGD